MSKLAAAGRLPAPAIGLALVLLAGSAAGLVAGSAAAQSGGLGSQDTSLPVEIEADLLTVEQDQSLAIFEGHVLATQGEMSLRADRLLVFYSDAETQGGQSIRRIEVAGNVVIASPTETATARDGVYDVVGESMALTGDVVLTQDDNVLKGDRLDIDLARNVHTMTTDGSRPGQRVRAMFQPPPDEDDG